MDTIAVSLVKYLQTSEITKCGRIWQNAGGRPRTTDVAGSMGHRSLSKLLDVQQERCYRPDGLSRRAAVAQNLDG